MNRTCATCLCTLQAADDVMSVAHALSAVKVKGQRPAASAHTLSLQVSCLWRKVVGESWRFVVGVALLGPHLFVVLGRTSHVLEYQTSTGKLQQRHLVEGLRVPQDMAAITAQPHNRLVISDLDHKLYLVEVVQGKQLTLNTVR